MNDQTKKDEESTGYCRPPNRARFKSGRSGNPKGRPKGSKNFATVWEAELDSRMAVTEAGRKKKISKREAVVKQVINKGITGDLRAASLVLSEQRVREERKSQQPRDEVLEGPADKFVIGNIVARIRSHLMEESIGQDPDRAAVQASALNA